MYSVGVSVMPKNNDRGFVLIDPFEDKILDRIFNDLLEYPVVEFKLKHGSKTWKDVNSKMSRKCKKVIDKKLLNPGSTARWRQRGFITLPMNVNIEIEEIGKKKKVILTRKLF